MEKLLLGIDIGTSACKVAVFNEDGKVLAQKSAKYNVYYPRAGWVEQDPEEWWDAVCISIKGMLAENSINPDDITGIGIDGQSWSAIPIDSEGNVLCNTPIWMDTRAADICKELGHTIGEERIFELCGNPLQPAYTLPKILWYKRYKNEMYKRIYKVLQSNSFIVYKLTDSITQDMSQGYGLQCFNMRKGCWDREMCRLMGIETDIFPDIYPCHEVVGTVTKKAAAKTGLSVGTPVVAGGLDAACGTLGAGVIHNSETQEQGGQAGGMSICIDEYNADRRLILSFHVVPGKWLLQGGTVGGGGVIGWLEKEFYENGKHMNGENSFYQMDMEAEKIEAGSNGLVFLPYMAGERSPIWDTNAKGVYFGFDYSKTRAHMIKASLEGVAFSLKHNLDAAEEAGAAVSELHAMGGAANSRLWTQIKADVTGKKVSVPSSDTATTLGAAILAGVGTSIYKDFDEAVKRTVRIKREHIPNMDNYEKYKRFYEIYLELYDKLKDTMKKV